MAIKVWRLERNVSKLGPYEHDEKQEVLKYIISMKDIIGVDMSTLDRQIIKTYDYLEYLRTLGKSYGTSEENYMTAKRIKEQFNEYLNSLPEDKRRLINAYIDQVRLR